MLLAFSYMMSLLSILSRKQGIVGNECCKLHCANASRHMLCFAQKLRYSYNTGTRDVWHILH